MDSQEKIVALYCRYSHEEDNNGGVSNSIANQKLLLEGYALEHNMRPVKVYADDGFTGTMFDRPDFQRMIKDIENGIVGTVIVKDSSRLGRNHIMVGYYTEEYFFEKGVRYISVCDGIDSYISSDETAPFRNIVNEMYARDISKKIKASIYAKAKKGKRMICIPIYGYKNDENKEWVIDETAAAIVRRIFSLYLEGNGIRTIANTLTKEGIPTPTTYKKGKFQPNGKIKYPDWSAASLKAVLSHQEYCGDTINF